MILWLKGYLVIFGFTYLHIFCASIVYASFVIVVRFGIIEQIEDALSDLKVIEFDGTCIKLSLRTYIPKLEDLLCEQKIGEGTTEPSDVNHEFLIEVINGTMELKNVEVLISLFLPPKSESSFTIL